MSLLYWGAADSNIPLYKKKVNGPKKQRGSKVKYSDDLIREIRIKYQKEGMLVKDIAILYPHIPIGTLHNIVEYKTRARVDVW